MSLPLQRPRIQPSSDTKILTLRANRSLAEQHYQKLNLKCEIVDLDGDPVDMFALPSSATCFFVPPLESPWEKNGIMATWRAARRLGIHRYFAVDAVAMTSNSIGWETNKLGRKYFEDNFETIELCHGALSDEQSRTVFAAALRARLAGDITYIPLAEYPQYYHPLVSVERGDVLCEGGVENGVTTIEFANSLRGTGRVIAFEPIKEFCQKMGPAINQHPTIELVAKGLSSESGISHFEIKGGGSRVRTEGGDHTVPCEMTTLDEYLSGSRCDMIKMDIEGAELPALRGALKTLERWRPKLAICVYHFPTTQFLEIINFVRALNLGYELYLGHHGPLWYETVLYARPVGRR